MELEVKQIPGVALQIAALPNIVMDLGGFTALHASMNTGQLSSRRVSLATPFCLL